MGSTPSVRAAVGNSNKSEQVQRIYQRRNRRVNCGGLETEEAEWIGFVKSVGPTARSKRFCFGAEVNGTSVAEGSDR